MPYRLALSREQRSTLPLVDSFLPDCEKNEHSSPFLTCYIPIFRFFLFFFLFSSPERKLRVSKTNDDRSKLEKSSWIDTRSIHTTPPFPPTFPFPSPRLDDRTCAFQLRRSLATPTFPVDPSPTSAPCSLAMFARCTARSLTYSWVYGTINPLRDSIITEAIKHLNV